jgi:hypothetical protein
MQCITAGPKPRPVNLIATDIPPWLKTVGPSNADKTQKPGPAQNSQTTRTVRCVALWGHGHDGNNV